MRAGWARHQIVIQAKTRVEDGGGGTASTWAAIANGTVTASITPVSSNETFAGEQLQERVSHKIMMRYIPGVTTAHRVLFGTRVLDIQSVICPQEKQRDLILMCVERKAV